VTTGFEPRAWLAGGGVVDDAGGELEGMLWPGAGELGAGLDGNGAGVEVELAVDEPGGDWLDEVGGGVVAPPPADEEAVTWKPRDLQY